MLKDRRFLALGALAAVLICPAAVHATVIGGVDMGNLPSYHMVFTDGSEKANWQGASKGFVGDVAVNGLAATLSTSGTVPYAGTLYTNAATQGAWQGILNSNVGQAFSSTGQVSRIAGLTADLTSAFTQINALTVTTGYASVASSSLNGLNTQNSIAETFVINVTSGFSVGAAINITGDASDVFILRWDSDGLSGNGYQGEVKNSNGGGIVPHGGLTPTNFINVAGDINASGGGTTPPPPYPQGPRFDEGQGDLITGGADFNGGGYFTGYWLTTGDPGNLFRTASNLDAGDTGSLSNAIFVGGWYTSTTLFSMTSGTSGVFVPEPASAALLVVGSIGLLARRRRQR